MLNLSFKIHHDSFFEIRFMHEYDKIEIFKKFINFVYELNHDNFINYKVLMNLKSQNL